MYSEMKPERLRAVGIPIEGSPEVLPSRATHVLYGLITNGDAKEFAIAVHDAYAYSTYRRTTRHPGDQGNWFFRNMELFFVPEGLAASGA
jgi:hypothetical protein